MPHPAQSGTDQNLAELQSETPPPDLKDGDPTIDPKKGLAEQGVKVYGTYADETTEESN